MQAWSEHSIGACGEECTGAMKICTISSHRVKARKPFCILYLFDVLPPNEYYV